MLATLLISSDILPLQYFSLYFNFEENLDPAITNMSYSVIVSIRLCQEVGNDYDIILCNFNGRRISVFEVIP